MIVDVTGWFTSSSVAPSSLGLFVPTSPLRHLDTRRASRVAAGGTLDVAIEGVGHVAPAGVSAVAANVTGVDATAPGYITVFPPSPVVPNVSNLNLDRAGQTTPNHVTVRLVDGRIRLFTERGAHLLVDVSGYYI